MKVSYLKKEAETNDIFTFWFKPASKIRFIAGQYIEVYIPHGNPDNRGEKRWFTISSIPSDRYLSITTRLPSVEKRSSFKAALNNLAIGDSIYISNPLGDFVLPKDFSIPIVCIAGGIGSTPFRSIIQDLFFKKEFRDITVIYNAHSKNDIAFRNTFNQLGSKFFEVIDTKINAEIVLQYVKKFKTTSYFYVSGPESMVEALVDDLKTKKIDRNNIFGDYFPGYDERSTID